MLPLSALELELELDSLRDKDVDLSSTALRDVSIGEGGEDDGAFLSDAVEMEVFGRRFLRGGIIP